MSAATMTLTPAQIAARRRALGLTSTKAAAILQIARVSLWRYESGHYHMSPKRQAQIDAALNVLEVSQRVAREAGIAALCGASAERAGQP